MPVCSPVQSGPPAEDGRCSDPILLAAGGGVPARMSRRPVATQLWLVGDQATGSASSPVTALLHGCDTSELNQTSG
jgi:hypothetical protein